MKRKDHLAEQEQIMQEQVNRALLSFAAILAGITLVVCMAIVLVLAA